MVWNFNVLVVNFRISEIHEKFIHLTYFVIAFLLFGTLKFVTLSKQPKNKTIIY